MKALEALGRTLYYLSALLDMIGIDVGVYHKPFTSSSNPLSIGIVSLLGMEGWPVAGVTLSSTTSSRRSRVLATCFIRSWNTLKSSGRQGIETDCLIRRGWQNYHQDQLFLHFCPLHLSSPSSSLSLGVVIALTDMVEKVYSHAQRMAPGVPPWLPVQCPWQGSGMSKSLCLIGESEKE